MIPSYFSEKMITQESRLCLPLALFQAAFARIHEHSHARITIAQNNFNQYFYIPLLQKWLSIFINDCIRCQTNKHVKMTHQKAALLPFSKMAPYFNYIISMDTKSPINPASEGHHYIYVIVDHFSTSALSVPNI